MKLSWASTFLLVVAATLQAKDNFTFGPVPPPSSFPELPAQTNPVVAPKPVFVPPSRLNALVPLPASRTIPSFQAMKPLPAAPEVVTPPKKEPLPKPVVVAKPVVKSPPPPVIASKPAPAPTIEPTPTPTPPPTKPAGATLLTSPGGGGLDGKLVMVDEAGRFAVINFPLGQMPETNQALTVSRRGVKVGEVLVTGPQRDDSIVADVVSGELRVGDEVRRR
ncbi:MAG: hypothetical protein NTZ16_05420 [Verrucomicrobia bacterium]|nr:hypothetical protein [Verrucomicrobiota bacterium]